MLHRAWIEYCNMILRKRYQGPHPHDFKKIWKTHPPKCPKTTLSEVFRLKLSYLHLISNGINESIIHLDYGFVINFLYSIYLIKAHSHLIQKFIIQKLVYKVKWISQINGGLFMFLGNLRIRFFKWVGSIVNNMERINTKKEYFNII